MGKTAGLVAPSPKGRQWRRGSAWLPSTPAECSRRFVDDLVPGGPRCDTAVGAAPPRVCRWRLRFGRPPGAHQQHERDRGDEKQHAAGHRRHAAAGDGAQLCHGDRSAVGTWNSMAGRPMAIDVDAAGVLARAEVIAIGR